MLRRPILFKSQVRSRRAPLPYVRDAVYGKHKERYAELLESSNTDLELLKHQADEFLLLVDHRHFKRPRPHHQDLATPHALQESLQENEGSAQVSFRFFNTVRMTSRVISEAKLSKWPSLSTNPKTSTMGGNLTAWLTDALNDFRCRSAFHMSQIRRLRITLHSRLPASDWRRPRARNLKGPAVLCTCAR